MALYLGNGEKVKVHFDQHTFNLNMYTPLMVNGIVLISADNYILKDINGVYLTAKEDE